MKNEVIVSVGNASEEYRRLAERLTALKEGFDVKYIGAGIDNGKDAECRNISAEMELQIRKLCRLADDLQETALNYKMLRNSEETLLAEYGGAADAEFGISEFSNLEKHKKLISIHME